MKSSLGVCVRVAGGGGEGRGGGGGGGGVQEISASI